MNTIRLQAFFEKIIQQSNVYIVKNDLNGFIRSVWNTAATEIPDLKDMVTSYYTPGFKRNDEQLIIEKFSSVKEAADKLLTIVFNAAVQNTDAGFAVMVEKLAELYSINKAVKN